MCEFVMGCVWRRQSLAAARGNQTPVTMLHSAVIAFGAAQPWNRTVPCIFWRAPGRSIVRSDDGALTARAPPGLAASRKTDVHDKKWVLSIFHGHSLLFAKERVLAAPCQRPVGHGWPRMVRADDGPAPMASEDAWQMGPVCRLPLSCKATLGAVNDDATGWMVIDSG